MVAANVGRTVAAFPPECRSLIRLLQRVNFGRVTFFVRAGQPDFTKPVRTVRTVKTAGGENGPRPEAESADYEIRKEVTTLIDQAAKAADGARLTVQIKHGLPFLIEVEEEHTA